MNDRVRALLDAKPDSVEAERLLAALPEAERREARALLDLVRACEVLPREAPADAFVERTLLRIRARPSRRGWGWLTARRLSPLQALATAAVGAALALVLGSPPRAPSGGPPAPAAVVLARLSLQAPLARTVRLAGDFNGWKPEATPLRRGANGVWSIELPLQPGRRYQYMFLVDGNWVTDPAASCHVDDGFGGQNAVLEV
jgi:hypothetical protein